MHTWHDASTFPCQLASLGRHMGQHESPSSADIDLIDLFLDLVDLFLLVDRDSSWSDVDEQQETSDDCYLLAATPIH